MIHSLPTRFKIGLTFLIVLSLYSLAFNSPNKVKAVTLRCAYSSFANVCQIQFGLTCPPGTHQDRQCPLDETCGQNGFDIQCISDSIPTPIPTPIPTDCSTAGGMCQPHDPSLCLGNFVTSPQCAPQMDSTGSSYQCCLPAKPPPTPSPAPPPDISGTTSVNNPAFPKSGNIPCDKEKEPEYSSDRPYQASPCGDPPQTIFCGNTVIIDLGSVSTPYNPSICGTGEDAACPADIHRDQDIVVDLTNVQLPILGNTQLTINSQSPTDQIDDGTKVNNFVSWYLNGVNSKAEYPPADTTTREGISKMVNYSGPLKKLLPGAFADAQRIDTISTASPDNTGEIPNHNQVVVCGKKAIQIIPSWITNIFGLGSIGLGKTTPTPCYENSVYRLKNWDNSPFEILLAQMRPYVSQILSENWYTYFFANVFVDRWSLKTPPLPWKDATGKPFVSSNAYLKAYQEWRGDLCVMIPFPFTIGTNLLGGSDFPLCVGIPGVTNNEYADLYPYVPLANTVDKKGVQAVSRVGVEVEAKTIVKNESYIINHSPQLYLAHSLENATLIKSLQSTFVPSTKSTATGLGFVAAMPNTVEDNSVECRILESRINPGDNATFSKPKSYIDVNVKYDITSIGCSKPEYKCVTKTVLGTTTTSCGWQANCSSDVKAKIPSVSKTPYADQIWEDAVASNNSVFQRIYPKVGPGAPVTCIADTPAVSSATYTLDTAASAPGIGLSKIIEPDRVTSFTGDGKTIQAQLFYPHYGGVLDYFLKGIQTALRPQGFADPTPLSGQYCVAPITCSGIAQQYGVPSCLIDAILFLESGSTLSSSPPSTGTESCGNFSCCSAGVCGPAQIKCGLYDGLSAGQNINLCEPCGAAELMSRLLLLKQCQAKGECNSYDWATMKDNALKNKITTTADAATAACYYYGQNQGCAPTGCTQYRWGKGKTYGDAVASLCKVPPEPPPGNTDPFYCKMCQKEDSRLKCP